MNDYVHPTNDQVLNVLSNVEGIIGQYVRRYPSKNRTDVNPRWLEDWFLERTKYLLEHPELVEISSTNLDELLEGIIINQVSVVKRPVTIVSLWPHYFRGFKNPPNPTNLTGKLVVIEGRNSTGKTSLAEAFEWLLNGQLVRRSFSDMGDAKELESCIGNQLKPEDEQTWVETHFLTTSDEPFKIKRLLIQDYGKEKSSMAESEFYVNDKMLNRQEEETFLDELFAGIPPVLMQHSLRTFVLSTPRQRRDYFERLLRLDEIADLIEKTVVGDARLIEFPSPLGSVAWKAWEDLKARVPQEYRRPLKRVEQSSRESITPDTETALTNLARALFGITDTTLSFDETKRAVELIQQQKRAISFPLLEALRPKKTIDPQLLALFSEKSTEQDVNDLEKRHQVLIETYKAAEKIGSTQLIISQTLEQLSEIGVVVEKAENQSCPMCEYDTPTLTQERINKIRSWQPIQQAEQDAETKYLSSVGELIIKINEFVTAREGLIPDPPIESEWSEAVNCTSDPVKEAASKCGMALQGCIISVKTFDEVCEALITSLSGEMPRNHEIPKIKIHIANLNASLGIVIDKAHEYLDNFTALENAVGKQAREDPDYNLREVWLSLVGNIDGITSDFLWEQSKKKAQEELEKIRLFLLATREKIIESRRIAFSDGMTGIWRKLRSDPYSSFSRLFIPPAKGKGLPLEIEIKAILDDGTRQIEVDALRVFSESQINILGIAAFATRSKLIGHRLIVLDDPVQSMDEDHFKTFCGQLLPELLGENGQVIILTHNETFARELSFAWGDKDDDYYVTMSIDHTRKLGCTVEEGSRRVSERLKRADKYVENGDLEKAWLAVRRAVERLYTLIRIKHGEQGFDHLSWRNATAEYMWKQGVKDIVSAKAPDATKRLEEIVVMTAAAAHDKMPYGATDLTNATSFVRQLVPKLKIGG
jgi:hypothetical protein